MIIHDASSAFSGIGLTMYLSIYLSEVVQVNLDMTDSMGPGKLVRHMQIRCIHMTNT